MYVSSALQAWRSLPTPLSRSPPGCTSCPPLRPSGTYSWDCYASLLRTGLHHLTPQLFVSLQKVCETRRPELGVSVLLLILAEGLTQPPTQGFPAGARLSALG